MAAGITYLGYTNHIGGDATVRFNIRGQEYEYHMSKRDAEIVNWLNKKGSGKALGLAKKRAYSFKRASIVAGSEKWLIRFWMPQEVLHERWLERKERYEHLGRRSIGWNPSNWDEPTDGEWNYWQAGAWGTNYKEARVFDSAGSARGAAKRHAKRGVGYPLEIVELRGGRPARRGERVAKKKYDHIDFKPPEGARKEARKALKWKEEHGDAVKGGTAVGWTRARQLADGGEMSVETVKRMYKFFQRHEKNKAVNPEFKGEPWRDNGYVAWLIWGGDAGKSWAEKLWNQMEAADAKTAKEGLWDKIREKRERGEKPAKPGDKDYPDEDTWKELTSAEYDEPRQLCASSARKKFNLKAEYSKWNRMLFGGELPMIPFKWIRSKRVGGYVRVRMNRVTGEHTALVLAISDYLTLDENRFNQIMIHEMIHVWQAVHNIEEPKGGHGRTFRQKAAELGAKVGLKIPLTEDITDIEVSDAVATKDFIVVLLEHKGGKGHMVFTESNWNSKKAKFESELARASKMYGMKFTIVKSNDRGLLKARHKKQVLGARGRISWNRSSPGFHEQILSGGQKEEVVKEKQTDYSKPRSMMLSIGKFLEKRLEKRFGTDFAVSVNTRSDSLTGRDYINVTLKSGRGEILIQAWFETGDMKGSAVYWTSGMRQESLWRGRKYPTPQAIMDALDKSISLEVLNDSFGVEKTAS